MADNGSPLCNNGDLLNPKKSYALGWRTIVHFAHILKLIFRRRLCIIVVCIIGLLSLLEQYIVYNVGIIPSGYYKVLGDADWEGFWKQTVKSLFFILAVSFVLSSRRYITNVLYVLCREVLTHTLHIYYFDNNKYYYMNTADYLPTDNPDQRLTQDVDKFCNYFSSIVSPVIISPFTISYYTYKCYAASGWFGPVIIFVIFVISAIFNRLLMKPIMKKVILQEKCEGFFRFKHMHIRTCAESIAFQDASTAEHIRSDYYLNNLITTQQSLFLRQFPLDISVNLFDYIGSIVSYVILAVPIFTGKYSDLSPSDIGALISKNAFISIYLINCFSKLVDLSTSVSQIAGLTYRVSEFLDSINVDGDTSDNITGCDDNTNHTQTEFAVKLENITFAAPGACIALVRNLSIKFSLGVHVLITGNSSSGKTSLLRIIKGLWSPQEGTIERKLPFKPSIIFFLPQKTLLSDGSLLKQIVYPEEIPKSLINCHERIEKIHSYLHLVDLEHILDKTGLEDDVKWNWYDVLSPGEAQRLSFVRLFYHKPKIAFLDEATSAVGLDMENKLYQKCKDLGITLVSVGHRTSLFQYHDVSLHLDGKGNWTLQEITH